MATPPNSFLCFSRAIMYVKKQRKLLGSGAITDGETDAKNTSVDGPYARCTCFMLSIVPCCLREDLQHIALVNYFTALLLIGKREQTWSITDYYDTQNAVSLQSERIAAL
jgi:hypothetical protein